MNIRERLTKLVETMRCAVIGHQWLFLHDAEPPVVTCPRCGRTDPMPYGDRRLDYP